MFEAVATQVPPRGLQGIASEDVVRALQRFGDLSGDVRGAAILGPGTEALAASGEPARWSEAANALLDAADAAAGRAASHAHVATEEGEVFAVRFAGLAMVAVTDRFALASLVLSDMRATLRELITGGRRPHEDA